ncbi:hypothetical protein SARC_04141 [Sphaeroforma arctica JP610]|uniref:Uncharacterized protein n=1 Tax=Sphaeroforma arctica JP610 TaxID=667725 RepID=A0A0L0G473_9EUKA|nr:hypothetical protein SARC_04141 [Sphaeroforma arctica JP610]KNC83606.1 hypothetical protein SARC_04141 [Sphaeroforma arctica JP610]|eukprot:XP_014157508.1 hypothetical protein SARC_04141 [Sphaeroforma arctica JP610]
MLLKRASHKIKGRRPPICTVFLLGLAALCCVVYLPPDRDQFPIFVRQHGTRPVRPEYAENIQHTVDSDSANLQPIAGISDHRGLRGVRNKDKFLDSPSIFKVDNSAQFAVAILSVPRNGSNVYHALSSLFLGSASLPLSSPVDLFVGTQQAADAFYAPLEGMPRVRVHPWQESFSAQIGAVGKAEADEAQRRRVLGRYNYGRALRHFQLHGHSNHRGLLVLEDDVQVGRDAMKRLQYAINKIEQKGGSTTYLLDCYVVDFAELTTSRFSDAVDIRIGQFTCSQCLYIPRSLVKSLAATIGHPDWASMAYDLRIDRFAHEKDVTVYAMRKSIVQHLGRTTTGLSGWGYHTSNRYE